MSVRHHLTVDVEEFFHASALERHIPREAWDGLPRRSPELVQSLLQLFDGAGVRATFFFLGWLGEREPEMVRAVAAAGHEVASHGWDHKRVNLLDPDTFREETRRSRALLQDLSGQAVAGFRAPSFSILPGTEWALDCLIEEGFRYDSSMFPVRLHPSYGYPDGKRDPHLLERASGSLAEVPPATLRLGRSTLPAGGGAYLRFFPVMLARWALESAQKRGAPATLYLHPWELDEAMPSFTAPWKTQLRMRGRVGTVRRKLEALLARFRFGPIIETVQRLEQTRGGEER